MIRSDDLDLERTPPRFTPLTLEHLHELDNGLGGVDTLLMDHGAGIEEGRTAFSTIDTAHEDLLAATDTLGPIPLTAHDHELAASATELKRIQSDAGDLHVGSPPGSTPATTPPHGPGGVGVHPAGNVR